MAMIESGTGDEVRRIVYEFFSEECEIPLRDIHDTTNVIKDL